MLGGKKPKIGSWKYWNNIAYGDILEFTIKNLSIAHPLIFCENIEVVDSLCNHSILLLGL